MLRSSDYVTNDITIRAHNIHLPLDKSGLGKLLHIQKDLLKSNFLSSFLTLAGSVVLFHFEAIKEIQDECPVIVCYSKQSGTGMYKINMPYIDALILLPYNI